MSSPALPLYRSLLRASRRLFAGDAANLAVARQTIRDGFIANRLETDAARVEEHLKTGQDALDFALSNVVQGQMTDRGHYSVTIEAEHAEALNKDPTVRPATKTALVSEPDAPTECCQSADPARP
jgi:hypothetical protein